MIHSFTYVVFTLPPSFQDGPFICSDLLVQSWVESDFRWKLSSVPHELWTLKQVAKSSLPCLSFVKSDWELSLLQSGSREHLNDLIFLKPWEYIVSGSQIKKTKQQTNKNYCFLPFSWHTEPIIKVLLLIPHRPSGSNLSGGAEAWLFLESD